MGRYILSVQNNRPEGRLIEEAFRQEGNDIELVTVYGSEPALERLLYQAHPLPSLVLMAARFPGMSGLELLRAIKSDARLRGIPVLVMEAYLPPLEVQQFFAEQASSVIEVPGKLHDLERAVRLIKDYWLGLAGLPSTACIP